MLLLVFCSSSSFGVVGSIFISKEWWFKETNKVLYKRKLLLWILFQDSHGISNTVLSIKQLYHPYLSSISHINGRINSKNSTNIFQSRTISLQTLKSQSTTKKSLYILRLQLRHLKTSLHHTQSHGRHRQLQPRSFQVADNRQLGCCSKHTTSRSLEHPHQHSEWLLCTTVNEKNHFIHY